MAPVLGANGLDHGVEHELGEAEDDAVNEGRRAGGDHEGADGDAGGEDNDDDAGDDGQAVHGAGAGAFDLSLKQRRRVRRAEERV